MAAHARRRRDFLLELARAVLEDGCRLIGGHGLEEVVGLAVMQRRPFEERDHFVEDGHIAGRVHVVRHAVAQPRTVVRDAAADSAARLGQPPVLDVAFGELPASGAQQMLARGAGCAAMRAIVSCSWSRKPYAPLAW